MFIWTDNQFIIFIVSIREIIIYWWNNWIFNYCVDVIFLTTQSMAGEVEPGDTPFFYLAVFRWWVEIISLSLRSITGSKSSWDLNGVSSLIIEHITLFVNLFKNHTLSEFMYGVNYTSSCNRVFSRQTSQLTLSRFLQLLIQLGIINPLINNNGLLCHVLHFCHELSFHFVIERIKGVTDWY